MPSNFISSPCFRETNAFLKSDLLYTPNLFLLVLPLEMEVLTDVTLTLNNSSTAFLIWILCSRFIYSEYNLVIIY
ncbi:MAG: hypothetical protein CM15mP127_07220 [Gammaproteobacteria bacterium]|nr:MAG: hypothetical protein CM15mP127_07220 [Gammaproteobacteria bacterium]